MKLNTDFLAREFANTIKEWLGKGAFKTMIEENKTPEYYGTGCCASHNYCDSNQAMIDVLETNGIIYGSKKFDSACSLVWDYARKHNFFYKS